MGQVELLCRDSVYSLHVTVTREFDVPEPDTVDTVVGVDINERNVALTALDRARQCRRKAHTSSITDNSNRNANATTLSPLAVRNMVRRTSTRNSVMRKSDSPVIYPFKLNAITDIDAPSYLLTRTPIPSRQRASHNMLVHTRIICYTTAAAVAAIDERIIKNTTNAFI